MQASSSLSAATALATELLSAFTSSENSDIQELRLLLRRDYLEGLNLAHGREAGATSIPNPRLGL